MRAEQNKGGGPVRNPKNTRSRRKRCPGCKKLRMKWLPANHVPVPAEGWARTRWAHLTLDGPLVCHICVERATTKETT